MSEIVHVPLDQAIPASLEAWECDMAQMFSAQNRGLTYYGYLERAQLKVNKLVSPKYARREGIAVMREEAGWFFAWICGFMRNMKIRDVSRVLFLRFPNCCNRCFERPCNGMCGSTPKDLKRARCEGARLWEVSRRKEKFTLESLVGFVRGIYPDNLEKDMAYAAGKLAEELGELKKAARKWAAEGRKRRIPDLDPIHEELSDVFFWFATLLHLVEVEATHPQMRNKRTNLDLVMSRMFKTGCPDCSPETGVRACTCQGGREHANRDLLDLQAEAEVERTFQSNFPFVAVEREAVDTEFEVNVKK